MVVSGRRRGEGGPNISRAEGPTVQRDSLRLAIPSALLSVLASLEALLPVDAPSTERIRLRDARAVLYRAYPALQLDEVQLAQELAEEDGIPIEDEDV